MNGVELRERRWRVSCWAVLSAGTMGAVGGAASAQERTTIAPKWAPAEVRYIEITRDIEEHTRGSPLPSPAQTTYREIQTCRQVVEPADGDGGTMRLTFDRLMWKGDGITGGTVQFDTDVGEIVGAKDALGSILAAMVGKTFTIEFRPDLRIRSCRGMDAIRSAAAHRAIDATVFAAMEGELTDEAAALLWGETRLMLYPPRRVRPWDSWARELKVGHPYLGELKYDFGCSLDELTTREGRPVAVVRYQCLVTRSPDCKPGVQLSGVLTDQVDGTIEGEAVFDVQGGLFVEQKDEAHVKLTLRAEAVPPADPVTFTTDRTIRRTIRALTEDERARQRAEDRQP